MPQRQGGPIQLFPGLETETPPPGRGADHPALRRRGRRPQGFSRRGPGGARHRCHRPCRSRRGRVRPEPVGRQRQRADPDAAVATFRSRPRTRRCAPSTRRLLMTGAPIEGLAEPGSVLGARARRLLAMGDLEGASALLDRVPATGEDSQIARLVVQAALLRGDQETACSRAADIAPASDAAFWAKVTIYCRLVDGDQDGARLGLDLLRDQGQTDDEAFFALAEMHRRRPGGRRAAGTGRAVCGACRAATVSPTCRCRARRWPRHRRSCWRRRRASRAWSATTASRWPSAPSCSARCRRTGSPSSIARPLALRAGTSCAQIAAAWGPRTRALAYVALPEQGTPERGQVLDALWRAAQGSERFLIAELFARALRRAAGRARPAAAGAERRTRPARGRAADPGGALVLAAERRCGRRPAGARRPREPDAAVRARRLRRQRRGARVRQRGHGRLARRHARCAGEGRPSAGPAGRHRRAGARRPHGNA